MAARNRTRKQDRVDISSQHPLGKKCCRSGVSSNFSCNGRFSFESDAHVIMASKGHRVDAKTISRCFKSKQVVICTKEQHLNEPESELQRTPSNDHSRKHDMSMKELIAAAQAKRLPKQPNSSERDCEHEHEQHEQQQQQQQQEGHVARDTFEGMLETLCRTKESIGRTTRQALECAKYGLAGDIVDIIRLRLQSEKDLYRRIDLFFLIDSITQCSFSHTGRCGNGFVTCVESVLGKLLNAAAPKGDDARENRKQCIKVLKLWVERKIMPVHLLYHLMAQIQSYDGNEEQESGSQRSIDDPLRDMDALFDEYGSNTLLSIPKQCHVQEVEDDEPPLPPSPPPSPPPPPPPPPPPSLM